MKDVAATLRRIDEEITGHNQNIARSRVEIMRLQDTRAVLMGIAEDDVISATMGREETRGVINGSHAKPVLIVRKVGSDEAMREQIGVNRSGNKRGMNNPPSRKRKKHEQSEQVDYRSRIVALLKGTEEPMIGREIGDHLGVPRGTDIRKPLQNALYSMRKAGQVQRDENKRYSLATQQ